MTKARLTTKCCWHPRSHLEQTTWEAENSRREKLNLPPASAKDLGEELEEEIVRTLNNSLGKSTLDDKLRKYGIIVYETYKEKIRVFKPKEKKQPQKSRRQLNMEKLRVKKKNLREKIKVASEAERKGLEQIWQDLKIKHTALRKAESTRKKKASARTYKTASVKGPSPLLEAYSNNQNPGLCLWKKRSSINTSEKPTQGHKQVTH